MVSTEGGRGDRVESRRGVVDLVLLSAVLVMCTTMMQVISGMTPRRGSSVRAVLQSKDSARSGLGNHVVCGLRARAHHTIEE